MNLGNFKKTKASVFFATALLGVLFVQTASADGWFDTYGKVEWKVEQFHLFNFAVFLQNDPEMIGYIGYNWRNDAEREEMRRRTKRAVIYLTSKLKIDRAQIVIIDGGKQKEARTVLQPVAKGLKSPDFR